MIMQSGIRWNTKAFFERRVAQGLHNRGNGKSAMRIDKFQGLGLSLSILGLVFVSSVAANAYTRTLNFCNKTDVKVWAAYGYEPAGSNFTQTKGWRAVQACQCVTLFSEDVRATELYYYVIKDGSGIVDGFNDGQAPLCVRDGKFRVGPSNKSKERCNASSGQWVNFTQVVSNTDSINVNFGSGGNCRG